MSFKAWLYNQLVGDEVISEEYSEDDITEDFLLMETDLLEDDIEMYRNQFTEHCNVLGTDPDWDLQ